MFLLQEAHLAHEGEPALRSLSREVLLEKIRRMGKKEDTTSDQVISPTMCLLVCQ
jgi:hypothetical protein